MLHAGHSSAQVRSVITITGLGDHDQPDWLITMTGIHNQRHAGGPPPPKLTRSNPARTGRSTRCQHQIWPAADGKAKVERARREIAAGRRVREAARLAGISAASVSRIKAAMLA